MKLVGIVMEYNEQSRGNLGRCLDNMRRYCDELVVFDDGSTDESVVLARQFTKHVLVGGPNDFLHETAHRQVLLEAALRLAPDYVLWLDADEVLDRRATDGGARLLCERGAPLGHSFSCEEVTIWRSATWRRLDYLGSNWHPRFWRVMPGMQIPQQEGLHNQLYPTGLDVIQSNLRVLHYGYATQEAIERRWRERTRLGVPLDIRRHGVDERAMRLSRVPVSWFPPGVDVPSCEPEPTPIQYAPEIMREAGWSGGVS